MNSNNNNYKFTYEDKTNCLILKNGNELIDYKFYNQFQIESLSIQEFLNTLKQGCEEIAQKNNIDIYIYSFL